MRASAPAPRIVPATAAPAPPESPAPGITALQPWLAAALLLLTFAAVGWAARRRSRRAELEPPKRSLRIFYSAAVFAFALALQLGLHEVTDGEASWRTPLLMALAAGVFILIGLVLFGIIDFWLGLLRPRRSRIWLATVMLTFALLIAGAYAILLLASGETGSLLEWDLLLVIALGPTVGLTWWSFLPAPRRDVARLFE